MAKNIQWKKSTLDYDKLNKLTPRVLAGTERGKSNTELGKIGAAIGSHESRSRGGIVSGNAHKESGHWESIQKKATINSRIAATKRALERKMIITNQLPLNEEFTGRLVRDICDKEGEHSPNFWKGILKETKLITKVYHGPNQYDPSRYKRIK
tara:strand:+ start:135 stop:593 length:459 start_codon:yes stop_codon:yes gene_type:complete